MDTMVIVLQLLAFTWGTVLTIFAEDKSLGNIWLAASFVIAAVGIQG